MDPISGARLRALKAEAQRLKATMKVGKEGLSAAFIAAVDDALKHRPLLKVRFDEFKAEKKTLAPELARKTGSQLVMRVGNVAVLYRSPTNESA